MAMISSIKVPINATMDQSSVAKKNSAAAVKKNAAAAKKNSIVVTTDSTMTVKSNSAKAAMDLRAVNIHLPMLLARLTMCQTAAASSMWQG